MKKLLTISALTMIAAGAFAQGTVVFNNNSAGTIKTHIYTPQSDNSAVTGNGSNDFPAGSTVYTGQGIGGTATGTNNGFRYSVQLWAAGGASQPQSSLAAVTQYTTTMRTIAGGAGFWIQVNPAGDVGIAGTSSGSATGQIRVWDNQAGTGATDWASAITQNATRGQSAVFNITGLWNGTGSPTPSSPLDQMTSFNVQSFSAPEPSTIALGVMGAAAFLLRRRNK